MQIIFQNGVYPGLHSEKSATQAGQMEQAYHIRWTENLY